MSQKASASEKSNNKQPQEEPQEGLLAAEFEELKRDMRSAQIIAWVQENQQQLIAAAVVLVMLLFAGGFWLEHERSQRTSAATLYHQAMSTTDETDKKSLMETVVRDYTNSAYGALALMHLARIDSAQAEGHLQALINHPKAMPEWVWQSRLDLAEIYLAHGDAQAVRSVLQEPVGETYEQLRHYLLALNTADAGEKAGHLQMALDATSHDEDLKQKIETMLATSTTTSGSKQKK
ncbi:MAG: tetratricopeptide repeat protein [Mariprofundaceae bacterium]